jgi:hypothetical protein
MCNSSPNFSHIARPSFLSKSAYTCKLYSHHWIPFPQKVKSSMLDQLQGFTFHQLSYSHKHMRALKTHRGITNSNVPMLGMKCFTKKIQSHLHEAYIHSGEQRINHTKKNLWNELIINCNLTSRSSLNRAQTGQQRTDNGKQTIKTCLQHWQCTSSRTVCW